MPRPPRSTADFAPLATEAAHPRAARLVTVWPAAGAQDNARDGEQRLRRGAVGPADVVCCIAASGTTPFVRAALEYARFRRAATILVTCAGNPEKAPGTATNGERVADVVIALE